ncbi:nucleolar complex protein 3 homolog isoform X2 [Acanthaster planci]|uniref:Nucleolar complex protein 3 homolog n=1 Tax=Acanthaster planci TaxID=133434 RepID=A0A8B8A0G1_ACAPL|nr:nucleolar complex protein 3 homolog isoform X2 [Acanthaster planci]
MAKKRGNTGQNVHKMKVSVTKLSNRHSSKSSLTKRSKILGKSIKSGPGKKPPKGFWNRASHAAGVKAGVIKEKKPQRHVHRSKQEETDMSKVIKDEELEEDEEEEDATEDFTGEDLEYIQSMGFGENFLSGVNDSEPPSSQKCNKRKRVNPDNELKPYEMTPRSLPLARGDPPQKMKQLLPIKHSKGFEFRWEEAKDEEDKERVTEDDDIIQDIDMKAQDVVEEKPVLPALSTVELFTLRERKLAQRKQRIASLSHAVLTDPEQNVNKLKDLRLMLEEKERDVIVTVQKLVMVSLVEVFKDIVPGYRIREWGEKAKAVELSKEVKKKRDFEEGLLKQYKAYLSFLEKLSRGHKKSKKQIRKEQEGKLTFDLPDGAKRSLSEVAVRCLCTLMTSLHHFNYRTNIINVVVSLLTSENEEICNTCCLNIRQLFKTDHLGEAVLDAVRFISRLVRSHNYSVSPKIMNTFLSLKIKDVALPEEEEKKKKLIEKREKLKKMSRSQRKHQKRLVEVEKELQATEASENKNKRKKLHTEIIQSVFATYFRILKKASNSVLLSSVLEGLSKFAHLINIDFFDDLVKVLYTLIDSGDLTYRDSLHCVLTAFLILSGQGDVLNIDPTKFYTLLYVTMPQVHAGESCADAKLILDCIDAMIIKRHKQVTFQRVLAFLKRLATLSLQMMPNGILGYGCAVRDIMKWYPKSDLLLDSESFGSGTFLPELPEAEHCNAQSTALWELHLLKRHYHPTVKAYSDHLSKGSPLMGAGTIPVDVSRLSAQKIWKEFNPDQMTFNPPIDTRRNKQKNVVLKDSNSDYIQEDLGELISQTTASTSEICDINGCLTDKILSNLLSNPEDSDVCLKRKHRRRVEHIPRKRKSNYYEVKS